MNISAELKQKFINRDGLKIYKLVFPSLSLTITSENMYLDTLSVKESLLSGSSMEFVGCIASSLSVDLHGITAVLKGQRIEAYCTIEDFEEEVPIFSGYVDSVKTRLEDSWKSITCYDDIYYKASDKDVALWYKSLSFPISIKNFRDSLFNYVGITQKSQTLVNDNITITQQYMPTQMNALTVIKSICQLNGVCGIINRDGEFEYRMLKSAPEEGTFPSSTLFPPFYPTALQEFPAYSYDLPYYKNMEYEDFDVYKVTKVSVRDTEDSASVSYGSGTNEYIVQGNMFVTGLDDSTRAVIAQNIYRNVKDFWYKPFDCSAVGLPFLEVGDCVRFNIADYTGADGTLVEKSFIVLNREIRGTQYLEDSYKAEGEQYQRVFITDLNARLEALKNKIDKAVTMPELDNYTQETIMPEVAEKIDYEISQMETPTEWGIVSCYQLPYQTLNNTLYCVQGSVVIS